MIVNSLFSRKIPKHNPDMHIFRWMLVTAVIVTLVNPTEAWVKNFRNAFKGFSESIGKVVINLQKPFRKMGCRVGFNLFLFMHFCFVYIWNIMLLLGSYELQVN